MTYTREQLLEAADILDAAHDVILRDGWASCTKTCAETTFCVEASCRIALGHIGVGRFDVLPQDCWLFALLHEHGIHYTWNDAASTTEDEVFDKLRDTAKLFRERADAP